MPPECGVSPMQGYPRRGPRRSSPERSMSPSRLVRASSILLVLAAVSARGVVAGPPVVGEARVTYNRNGTVLRAEADVRSASAATLPVGTRVVVEEVKAPWVRVRSTQPPATGWIKAYEATEPSAVAAAPPSANSTYGGGAGAGVSQREASMAGRQFTAGTERGYRAGRQDLAAGYAAVDRMEAATAALDGYDSIAFIMEGDLGRRGVDYGLPARLPPTPEVASAPPSRSGPLGGSDPGGLFGKIGGRIGKELGGSTGEKIGGKLASALGAARKGYVERIGKDLTPDQEYYVGRAVAATAIAKLGVDPDESRRRYVRRIGDAVVRCSPGMQANFGGYHFEVLASDEINGVSGPGGFVLITRGAVLACKTEDELAGVLAHELAHVRLRHGVQALQKSRQFQSQVGTIAGVVGALLDTDALGFEGKLVELFTTAVSEVAGQAVEHNYDPSVESQADQEGSRILWEVMYDWTALRALLARMATNPHVHGGATHESPAQRAQRLDGMLPSLGAYAARPGTAEARLARFQSSLGTAPR